MKAAAMHKLHSGGISRTSRRIYVVSVALRGLPAETKYHFCECNRAFRRTIQREICKSNAICATFATKFSFWRSQLNKQLSR